jgi:hypothetical protein
MVGRRRRGGANNERNSGSSVSPNGCCVAVHQRVPLPPGLSFCTGFVVVNLSARTAPSPNWTEPAASGRQRKRSGKRATAMQMKDVRARVCSSACWW